MTTRRILLGGAFALAATALHAQGQPVISDTGLLQSPATAAAGDVATGFESENAILDTSIPFAAGAREARQELRGAFGWSTFQEGQVHGVYFRFDPDGYARFSTTPRLDTDVFEVICRPRTLSCLGRKDGLSVTLSVAGQIELGLDNRVVGDQFFLSEGLSEVQLPERVLGVLEPQMEGLLSTGGELVVRRGGQEVARISLYGFHAVTAYLRWIAARQDYAVLPATWPVHNGAALAGVPTPSPVFGGAQYAGQGAPILTPVPDVTGAIAQSPAPSVAPSVQTDMAEVKGELNVLRQLLLSQQPQAGTATPQAQVWDRPTPSQGMMAPAQGSTLASGADARLTELERTNMMLMHELQRMRSLQDMAGTAHSGGAMLGGAKAPVTQHPQPGVAAASGHANPPGTVQHVPAPAGAADQPAPPQDQASIARATAEQLEYLMSEIGLDARTALLLIQSGQAGAEVTATGGAPQSSAYQDALVTDILAELQAELPDLEPGPTEPEAAMPAIPPEEFVLLSEYFRSVMAGR